MSTPVPDRKLRHSRVSKTLVLIAGIVLFLFFVVSLFLDKKVDFSVEIVVQVPVEEVIAPVSDLRGWRKWSVWSDEYYRTTTTSPVYETNRNGEVIRSVERQLVNDQTQVIVIERTEKTSERVVFEYSFWDGEENSGTPLLQALSTFTFTPDLGATRIAWGYDADYSPVIGINPLQKYFLMFTEFTLERAYRQSLESLKKQLEK